MGEIKSTLDIVMERLKGLKVSEEDKKGFRLAEIKEKIGGLIQRYLDEAVDDELVIGELKGLLATERGVFCEALSSFLKERLGQVQRERDLKLLIEILKRIFTESSEMMEALFYQYQKELDESNVKLGQRYIEGLKGLGISGSSILPNTELLPDWQELQTLALDRLKGQLLALINK